jgi:peroxiredoxin
VPSLALASTGGGSVDLARLPGRAVVFGYPRTGVPGEAPLVADWDAIPGARGCTPQACDIRDHVGDLLAAGADHVFGLSTQTTTYQQEAVRRLHLPYRLLSDHDLALTEALRLPTFEAAGQVLLRRLTLVLDDGVVTHAFYPVFPPDSHTAEVLAWLRSNPR